LSGVFKGYNTIANNPAIIMEQAADLTIIFFSLKNIPPTTTVRRFEIRFTGMISETIAAGIAMA